MKDTLASIQAKLVETAKAILAGHLGLVAGCRELNRLCRKLQPLNRELFNPIIGFESETDHYPVGEARQQYERTYLERLDKEVLEYSERSKPAILAACRKIVQKYDHS